MKTCNLCYERIDEKKERYVHVEDWENKKMQKEIWCHLNCFVRGMNKDLNEMERNAKQLLNKATQMLDKLVPSEEVYLIR